MQAGRKETKPCRATGNEPGWQLQITDTTMTWRADNGQTRIMRPAPVPETGAGFRRYVAKTADKDLTVTIFDRRCTDTMSGLPHPNSVVVVSRVRR
jgi:uncharacterized membrane protein